MLGVPTVADRVAQTVVAIYLGERAEPRFHPDSYGYRPGEVVTGRTGYNSKALLEQDWVLDLDVRPFFDSVPHDLLLKAVGLSPHQTVGPALRERWLKAPMQMLDGTLSHERRGPRRALR